MSCPPIVNRGIDQKKPSLVPICFPFWQKKTMTALFQKARLDLWMWPKRTTPKIIIQAARIALHCLESAADVNKSSKKWMRGGGTTGACLPPPYRPPTCFVGATNNARSLLRGKFLPNHLKAWYTLVGADDSLANWARKWASSSTTDAVAIAACSSCHVWRPFLTVAGSALISTSLIMALKLVRALGLSERCWPTDSNISINFWVTSSSIAIEGCTSFS